MRQKQSAITLPFILLLFAHILYSKPVLSAPYSSAFEDLPDLQIRNLEVDFFIERGTVVSFTFDLVNAGTLVANGDYTIGIYLSKDASFDEEDLEVGTVPTGNTPIGTIDSIVGAADIPANIDWGEHYLFVIADINNDISEQNEENNFTASRVVLIDDVEPPVQGTDECGFIKSAGNYPTSPTALDFHTVIESDSGYSISGTADIANSDEVRQITTHIDLNGDWRSLTDGTSLVIPEMAPYSVNKEVPNLIIQKNFSEDSIAWTRSISFEDENPLDFIDPKAYPIDDGVLIIGTYVTPGESGVAFIPFVLKLSDEGEEVKRVVDFIIPDNAILSSNQIFKVNSGYIFDTRLDISELGFVGVPFDMDTVWYQGYTNDLPSNRVADLKVSLDGNYIYAANVNNSQSNLVKVDVFTGEEVYEQNLNTYFYNLLGFPFFQSIFTWDGIIATEDGGVVFGYDVRYFGVPVELEAGYVFGKVDSSGNILWGDTLQGYQTYQAIYEATDGGYLFVKDKSNGENQDITIMKVTSAGSRNPDCSEILSCDITEVTIDEAPSCNEDGTYRVCLRVVGQALPDSSETDLSLSINHQIQSISSYTKIEEDVIICLDSLVATDSLPVNVVIQLADACTYTSMELYDPPQGGDCLGTNIKSSIGQSLDLNIYPNPSYGKFNMKVSGVIKANFEVRNILGQIIKSGRINNNKEILLDLSTFDAGIYTVSIRSNDQVSTKRIIKK